MNRSKLILLLNTFSKDEFRELGKFIYSPYFNSRKELIRFYEVLKKSGLNGPLNKKLIFEKVFPDYAYNDVLFRKLVSNMKSLTEKYLIQLSFENDNFSRSSYLLGQLSQRKLDKLFSNYFKQLENELSSRKKNSEYYYKKSKLVKMIHDHKLKSQNINKYIYEQEYADIFHQFYINRILELSLMALNDRQVIRQNLNIKFYDEVMNYVSENLQTLDAAVKVHYNLIQLINTGEKEYFDNLVLIKDKENSEIDRNLLFNIFICLTNYCIDMVNKGKPEFRKEKFLLDKEFLKSGLMSEKEYFPVYYYIAVIATALPLNELKWTQEFIEEYHTKLDPHHRNMAYNYSLASLDFTKGDYNSSLEKLASINTEYSSLKIYIKFLTIKAYCELKFFDSAYSLIDSCKHFLRNDKQIPEDRKENYTKFINSVSELINAETENNKYKRIKLKQNLMKSSYFIEKEWVVKKAEQIKD